MTALLRSSPDSPVLIAVGWALLVVLWHSTLVGLALAIWRSWRVDARPREQYRAAALALGGVVLLAGLTPALVLSAPGALEVTPANRVTGGPGPVVPGPQHSAARSTAAQVALESRSPLPANAIAAFAAVVWLAGVLVLAVRLAGGLYLAHRIRRRSQPISLATAYPGSQMSVGSTVVLLQSAEVEAPAVIGWRPPAVVLPADAGRNLSPDMLAAVLAHEMAHVRRRDYVVNALQSVVEVLLFFSPAVHWISARMREAREYCCDDDAVGVCSNRSDYVKALTTLASLATVNAARPVIGASGPRLITRVRRLLQEESMPRSSRLRALSLAAVFLILAATGAPVSMTAAGRSAGALAFTPQLSMSLGEVPFGYANIQDGSGVSLRLSRTVEPFGYAATLRNLTREPVVEVRFATVVERVRVRPRVAVRVFVSQPVTVDLPAASETTVPMPMPTEEQVKEVAAGDGSIQFFFGVVNVRFANGFVWQVTPNTAEVSGDKALGLSSPQLARTILEREAGDPSGRVCRDEQGDAYSLGAVVPIQNEPGRFARCEGGRWVEQAGRR